VSFTPVDPQDGPLGVANGRDEHPSFLRMIGIVAAGVAITILVFFAAGYAFGRLFL
jgi:hypothetical protein